MERTRCVADAKHIRHFLNICDASWHNCIHVKCLNCTSPMPCKEPGFLFLPDADAVPCVLPLSDANFLFSRMVEADECLCTMTLAQFRSMYREYLEKLPPDSVKCPCKTLLDNQGASYYDW